MAVEFGTRDSEGLRKACPHCGMIFNRALDPAVYDKPHPVYFGPRTPVGKDGKEEIIIYVYECPRCGKETIDLHRYPYQNPEKASILTIDPLFPSREVPPEVPEELRSEFAEAVRVSSLSLKGATTLARRCLQATIRHCFPEMPRGELFSEIKWLENEDRLPGQILTHLHSLRKAGNFGAHPPKDGLSIVYDLSKEDLEGCFLVLQTMFDILIVIPSRRQRSLEALRAKISGESSPEDRGVSLNNAAPSDVLRR